MIIRQATDLLDHLDNIIHAETQQHKLNVDLTVGAVFRLTGPAYLDFGGSEFRSAETKKITPEKKNPSDDYGWWNLEGGSYRLSLNEQLNNLEEALVLLSPHNHLRQAGIISDTVVISSEDNPEELFMHIRVPQPGCHIKENARVATVHLLAGSQSP